MPAKTTQEVLDKVKELKLQNKTAKEIAQELNITKDSVHFLIKKLGLTKDLSISEEIKEKIVTLRKEKVKIEDIATRLGIKECQVRYVISLFGVPLSKEDKKDNYRKLPQDLVEKALSLRAQGAPLKQIANKLSVPESTIKNIFSYRKISIPMEIRQANAIQAKSEKNPNYLEILRNGITAEVVQRRTESIRETYRTNPELSIKASEKWHSKPQEEKERISNQIREANIANPPRVKKILTEEGYSSMHDRFVSYVEAKGGQLLSEYKHSHDKVLIGCENGHKFEAPPYSVSAGHWCPHCCHHLSKAQKEIFEIINSWGVKCELSDRTVIKPLEIDILCPNEKLAFEYNGLYWHSNAIKNNNGRHLKKKKALETAGYSLFAIFDDEWDSNRPLVENMLKRRLGKFSGVKLNARDMQVELVELHEASDFFKKHHLDGAAPASKFFGLRHFGELVACASLRKNFAGEFELGRFATHMDYIVRGAAGKLIKAVRMATGQEPLVSYSNNRLSDGDIYKKLGFEFVRDNPPSYWYTDGKVRVWRWKCKKDNSPEALAKGHTEQEQAAAGVFSQKLFGDDRPLFKIEDYGHKKWILR